MTRTLLILSLVTLVAACGGRAARSSAPKVAFATGPIYSACLKANRKSASTSRCGCIQAVADQQLSSRDQSRAVPFFSDPHSAQETRQSDNPFNEAFWKRYRAYADTAARQCSAS